MGRLRLVRSSRLCMVVAWRVNLGADSRAAVQGATSMIPSGPFYTMARVLVGLFMTCVLAVYVLTIPEANPFDVAGLAGLMAGALGSVHPDLATTELGVESSTHRISDRCQVALRPIRQRGARAANGRVGQPLWSVVAR